MGSTCAPDVCVRAFRRDGILSFGFNCFCSPHQSNTTRLVGLKSCSQYVYMQIHFTFIGLQESQVRKHNYFQPYIWKCPNLIIAFTWLIYCLNQIIEWQVHKQFFWFTLTSIGISLHDSGFPHFLPDAFHGRNSHFLIPALWIFHRSKPDWDGWNMRGTICSLVMTKTQWCVLSAGSSRTLAPMSKAWVTLSSSHKRPLSSCRRTKGSERRIPKQIRYLVLNEAFPRPTTGDLKGKGEGFSGRWCHVGDAVKSAIIVCVRVPN